MEIRLSYVNGMVDESKLLMEIIFEKNLETYYDM